MTLQTVNVGSNPNDGTGDELRNAMIKINSNFTDLYNTATITANVINVGNTSMNTYVNSSGIYMGNTTVNAVINSISGDWFSTTSNTSINASSIWIGNTSDNIIINANTVSSMNYLTMGNTTANLYTNSTAIVLSDTYNNITMNTSTIFVNSFGLLNTGIGEGYVTAAYGSQSANLQYNGLQVGANVWVYAAGVSVGNTTVNSYTNSTAIVLSDTFNNTTITTSSIFVNGGALNTLVGEGYVTAVSGSQFANLQYFGLQVGANVGVYQAGVSVGNTTTNSNLTYNSLVVRNATQNTVVNSSVIALGNSTSNASFGFLGGGWVTGTSILSANASTLSIGNSTVNTFSNSTHFFSGNSTYYGFGNATYDVIVSPTSNLVSNSSVIALGNSTVNATINSTMVIVGSSNVAHTVSLANGYSRINNGLLMQWGTFTTVNTTAQVVTYTSATGLAFSTNTFSVTGTSNSATISIGIYAINSTSFTIISNSATASAVSWMAIGI